MPETAEITVGVRLAREEEDGDVIVDFGFFCANLSAEEAEELAGELEQTCLAIRLAEAERDGIIERPK